jgi:DHA1 family bicyclomycin/chloramphenicol resistance-like MFS transporter
MHPALLTVYCGLLLSVSAFSNDILLPSMFAIQREFDTPIESVQLVVPVFMFVAAFGQLVFGAGSDRFGRRYALMAGLSVYLLGSATAMQAGGIGMLLVGRGLQGFGSSCCQVVARAILRDTNQGAQLARAMALATAIFSFGPIGAPLLGILLLSLGDWRAVFGAMLAFGGLLLAATALLFKETNHNCDPRALEPARLAGAFARVFRHPQSRFFLLAASLQFFGIVSYVANSPRLFRTAFGIEGIDFGLLFAATGVGIIIGQIANSRLIARYGVVSTTRAASIAMTVIASVLVVLAVSDLLRWWSFTALIFGFNALFLVVFSNSASLVIDPHKEIAGLAASTFGCVTQLFGSSLMLLTLPVMRGDILIWSMSLLAITAVVCVALLLYRPEKAEDHQRQVAEH